MKKLLCFIGFLTICCHSLFSENLSLDFSGDVRTKWKCSDLKGFSDNSFIFESNINCNYFEDNSWMEAKGRINLSSLDCEPSVYLERTYVGFSLSDEIYLEVGRNNLDNLFDSKVQYKSHFNGIHFNFSQKIGKIGTICVHGGPYIEDGSKNRLAAIAEISTENILDTNLNITYSLTYHCYDLISQVVFKFPFRTGSNESLKILPYIAFLRNHDYYDNGIYFGTTIGEIKKAKDFSIDINLQSVSCIPGNDFSGVGKGIQSKAIYSITNNLHAQMKASFVQHYSNTFEFSLIYHW